MPSELLDHLRADGDIKLNKEGVRRFLNTSRPRAMVKVEEVSNPIKNLERIVGLMRVLDSLEKRGLILAVVRK